MGDLIATCVHLHAKMVTKWKSSACSLILNPKPMVKRSASLIDYGFATDHSQAFDQMNR